MPWGRSSDHFWKLSIGISLLIAATDALLGPHFILVGLLIAGPCCALFSARWVRTAQTGALAVGLALVLAIPDGIWGTSAQFAFVGAVLMVAIVCTWAASIMEAATRR